MSLATYEGEDNGYLKRNKVKVKKEKNTALEADILRFNFIDPKPFQFIDSGFPSENEDLKGGEKDEVHM